VAAFRKAFVESSDESEHLFTLHRNGCTIASVRLHSLMRQAMRLKGRVSDTYSSSKR